MELIQYEKKEHIAVVTISREKALNALNEQVMAELDSLIDDIQNDNDVYCVIVTGAGERSFVAGADIGEMKDFDVAQAAALGENGNRIFRKLEQLRIPTIAAVNGFALGGGLELALSCDIRIASGNAVFGLPEVSLGITPGYGGTQRLPRTIGVGAAKKLIYTAGKVKADEALRLGLLEDVVPIEELMDSAMKLAGRIAQQAPIAVANAKAAIGKGLECDMDRAVQVETAYFAKCFNSEDQKDAMNAFVSKQKMGKFKNK